jgi:pyruvate/2-oxoglutarate dehydrogenase complex dihydrolipoamide acyltransferase (E2) component
MSSDSLKVPEEIPGDEIVLVTKISRESGSLVKMGEPIFEIETSKTSYQIDAETSGVLHHHLKVGDEVASGDKLGEIATEE